MNQPDPFDRLRRQIHAASTQIRLAPGSEQATIRTAHRRRNRGRALVGAAAAVAVGSGTVVAVQQLGKTSPGAFGVGNGDGTVPDNAVAPAETVVPQLATAPGVAVGSAEWFAGFPETIPAELVESNYSWNPIPAGAAEAVFYKASGAVPGVVVASAPSTAGGRPRAFYTADGVSYDEIPVDPPNGDKRWTFAAGDSIYSIGTAPGTAAGANAPLYVDVSPDRGQSWQATEQVDIAEPEALEFVASWTEYSVGLTDAGPLVVANSRASLDVDQLPGWARNWYGYSPEGLTVTENGCDPYAGLGTPITIAPGAGAEVPYYPADDPAATSTTVVGECPTRVATWDELGVPAESVAAITAGMSVHSQAFLVTADGPTEIGLPTEEAFGAWLQEDGRVQVYDSEGTVTGSYRLAADGTWSPEPVLPFERWLAAGPVTVGGLRLAPLNGPEGSIVVASSADGVNWTYASGADLFEDYDKASFSSFGHSADAMFGVVGLPDPAAPGEVVVNGVSAVYNGENGTWDFFEEDGEPVDRARVVQNRDDGTVAVKAPDDSTRAEFPELWRSEPGNIQRWALQSTSDGVHVASESLAEILGVGDDQIGGVGQIRGFGRQVVLSVYVTDGAETHSVLLVGTPNE